MKLIILLVSLTALGLALTVAVSGPGTRFGLWEYGTGLGLIRTVALPVLAAAVAAALSFVLALVKVRGLAPLALVAAIAAGAAGAVPLKMKAAVEANPFIHDITTDFENPPQIITAADLPRKNPPDYLGGDIVPRSEDGMTVAAAQSAAFPDIAPLVVAVGMDDAVNAVRAAIEAMGMEVLGEGPVSEVSGSGWRIEAVDTSTWFGFKDDFIVRLTAAGGDGTRIDVRSKSRIGASDLGANAARVRAFMEKLKE